METMSKVRRRKASTNGAALADKTLMVLQPLYDLARTRGFRTYDKGRNTIRPKKYLEMKSSNYFKE